MENKCLFQTETNQPHQIKNITSETCRMLNEQTNANILMNQIQLRQNDYYHYFHLPISFAYTGP